MRNILLLSILLCSCSILKNTHKTEDKKVTDTETKVQEKTEASKVKESDIKTVTEASFDTTLNVAGSSVEGTAKLKSNEPWTLDDSFQSVTITQDSSGKLKVKANVKPRNIPVTIIKKTTKTEKIKETEIKKTDSTAQEKKQEKTELVTVDKEKKTTFGIPWWIWLILVLIAIAAYLWRKYKPF
jgi:hypothetical protein